MNMNSSRIEHILASMKKNGMDALFITSPLNRRYLSGFTGTNGFIYLSQSKKLFLTDFRYTEQAVKECTGFDVIDYGKGALVEMLNAAIHEDGTAKMGFENRSMTVNDFDRFSSELNCEMVDMDDMVERLREIKDESELEAIRQAASIGDKAFEYILDFLKPGVSEKDIAIELEYFMKRQGATKLSFDTIVASGKRSSLPHAQPTDKKLEPGDFITLDFGCIYNGYCSDMTRTVVLGKASSRQWEIYELVLKAQLEALSGLKAGLTGAQVDKIARDIISGAGYGEYFGHGLGHSLGLDIHEDPRVSFTSDAVLEPNMMVTIEPGIYIPDFGGVRIEDLVRITKESYENFCRSEKTLLEV